MYQVRKHGKSLATVCLNLRDTERAQFHYLVHFVRPAGKAHLVSYLDAKYRNLPRTNTFLQVAKAIAVHKDADACHPANAANAFGGEAWSSHTTSPGIPNNASAHFIASHDRASEVPIARAHVDGGSHPVEPYLVATPDTLF